jgi:hypothetical protein
VLKVNSIWLLARGTEVQKYEAVLNLPLLAGSVTFELPQDHPEYGRLQFAEKGCCR